MERGKINLLAVAALRRAVFYCRLSLRERMEKRYFRGAKGDTQLPLRLSVAMVPQLSRVYRYSRLIDCQELSRAVALESDFRAFPPSAASISLS